MASSMTGFGIGEVQQENSTITVELKSVNNRFLEVSCRMPSFLSHYEREVKEIIRNKIQRGKIYMMISVQGETNGALGIRVEPETAQAVRHLLGELRRATGVREKLRLEHFLKFSEIFEPVGEPEDTVKVWEGVKEALQKALTDLRAMRDQEGKILAQDLVERVKNLEQNVDVIERLSRESLPNSYEKMLERVKRLVGCGEIDTTRMESEIALMADKMDVTEECVRLRSHNELFLRILEKEAVVGKKLNFLLQEMNREANTVSAKATHVEISHLVIKMKEEIEKLREQVQNLE